MARVFVRPRMKREGGGEGGGGDFSPDMIERTSVVVHPFLGEKTIVAAPKETLVG